MLQTTTARESLPPAYEDYTLDYERNCGAPSRCRIRVYRPRGSTVIVATELADNPGGSVTNTAETVHFLAWERAGTEEFDQVVFPVDAAGRPHFRERMLYPGRWETQFDEADRRPFGREALLDMVRPTL